MRTYASVLQQPSFRVLFLAHAAASAATVVSGLALASLVYSRTGSPFLTALTMFGSSLGQLAGATLLLSAADRVRPRPALASCALVPCLATAVLATPELSVGYILGLQFLIGIVAALAGGVRWSVLDSVLSTESYALGRSAFNISVGLVQVVGYGATGLLLQVFSSQALLVASACFHALAAVLLWVGIENGPGTSVGRATISDTFRHNAALLRDPHLRPLLLATWIPNGLIVGAESLYVPYAPNHAGLLFSAAACGMLIGDVLGGRLLSPTWRRHLSTPLRLLLATPYLAFVFHPSLAVSAVLVGVASMGYGATLLQQERLVALAPGDRPGQLLGLQSSGMLTVQALGAAVAGGLAETLGSAPTMASLAVASLAVSALLTPGLRRSGSKTPSGPRIAARAGERRGQTA